MTSTDTDRAKKLAKVLREDLAAAGLEIPYGLALELISHQFGAKDWIVLAALAGRSSAPAVGPGVPVLRVTSVAQVLPFCPGSPGFPPDWEHRFEPGLPLYVRVSRSAAVLHLSEHHGDGGPRGVAWFPVRDVSAPHEQLLTRPNAPMRPGTDPDGNTLRFPDGNTLRFAQSPSAQWADSRRAPSRKATESVAVLVDVSGRSDR